MKPEIRRFLEKNKILELETDKQLAAVAKLVSKIPFGEARTIEEVLVTKRVGTCTGKHLVLQACFDELGIKYRPVVCTFRWQDQKIRYPENIRKILAEGAWEHGHNFVQFENGVELDITWNPELKKHGFLSLPDDWDGTESFIGIDKMVRRWNDAEILSMKKELIGSLSPEIMEIRERFLKALFEWVDTINKN